MEHPEISIAVAFAAPHPTLGEDIAVAVVLSQGSQLTRQAVREFAFDHLADFKVPSQVLIVDKIPTGPTGKLQRIGLAQQFALELEGKFEAPENDVEKLVAETIGSVLSIDRVGAEANFFAIGGDSLTANQVVLRLNDVFHSQISMVTIFRSPTVRELAQHITEAVVIEDEELLEKLLTEVEDLTESEVLALLDEELDDQ